jgi:hypothetical protein
VVGAFDSGGHEPVQKPLLVHSEIADRLRYRLQRVTGKRGS